MRTNQWALSGPKLLSEVESICTEDGSGVLVTVIDVEGSAYRRPGAKMVIREDGTQLGSVTAGCLESTFVEIASAVMEHRTARVETFDLRADDDVWGLGVGCNGVITILFEPLDGETESLRAAIADERPVALVTVFDDSRRITARGVVDADGEIRAGTGSIPSALVTRLRAELRDALTDGASTLCERAGRSVFVDGMVPPPRLLVVGNGNDVSPLVELGAKTGFTVDVATFRSGSAVEEHHPDVGTVYTTSPDSVAEAASLDENTYVVVMSHNFVDDTLALESALASPVPYIGLLGPRDRFSKMLDEPDIDIQLADGDRERIYAPVGLNLGGGSPYQIAHSIVAEVLAVHHDREVMHLSERGKSIHAR